MTNSAPKIAAIGECMIEMRKQTGNTFIMGFAGDTLNVATYLARLNDGSYTIDYITAVGNDPYSNTMLDNWQQEGIGTDLIQKVGGCLPGAYFIDTDAKGERKFYYYRGESAAKQLFYSENIDQIVNQLITFDCLYLSGISLAILDNNSREWLLRLLSEAREQGATICFDSNYRAKLWENKPTAQLMIEQAYRLTDIALSTFSDEQNLMGDIAPEQTAKRLREFGIKEVVVKHGEKGCLLVGNDVHEWMPAQPVPKVIDTTAAGDSFNAGYIAARIKGYAPNDATHVGHRLAARVIRHPGGIIDLAVMPDIF